ncbi:MAG TPA: DUF1801 domain-containing protein [Rhizobiaceae bacterium]|nr:DUF1801 domain-containing protein [Rhizobiaceae bacterium]
MSVSTKRPFADPAVASLFASYPKATRRRLMDIRNLIFDVAAKTEGVGELEEGLRWGQPSYLTTESGSGSTVRIDASGNAGGVAVYFICTTNLVDSFVSLYPGVFNAERNRALHFGPDDPVPTDELAHCVALALTHRARNKPPRRGRPPKPRG